MTLGPTNVALTTPIVRFTSGDVYGTGSPTTGSTFYELSFYAWITSIINTNCIVSGGTVSHPGAFQIAWVQTAFIVSGYYVQLIAGSITATGTSSNQTLYLMASLVRDPILNTVTGVQASIQSSSVPPVDGFELASALVNSGNSDFTSVVGNPYNLGHVQLVTGSGKGQFALRASFDTKDYINPCWIMTPSSDAQFGLNQYYDGSAYQQIDSTKNTPFFNFVPVSNNSTSGFFYISSTAGGQSDNILKAWYSSTGWGTSHAISVQNQKNSANWDTVSDPRTKIVDRKLTDTIDIVQQLCYLEYRHNGLFGSPLDDKNKKRWGLMSSQIKQLIPDAVGYHTEKFINELGKEEFIEIESIDNDKIQAAINNSVVYLIDWVKDLHVHVQMLRARLLSETEDETDANLDR